MRNYYLIFSWFCITLFTSSTLFSQDEIGKPFITNYFAKDYIGHSQNWAAIQDDRGFIYIANGNGILVYDGKNWEMIQIPNNVTIRAFAKDKNGLIYASSVNELGYLQPNKFGKLEYISLSDSLGLGDKIETIWNIQVINDDVFFRSTYYLIRLNENGFTYWKSKSSFTVDFIYNNIIYVIDKDFGLYNIKNDSLTLVPDGNLLKGYNIDNAQQMDNVVLLIDNQRGLFSLNIKDKNSLEFKFLDCEANFYIKKNIVYKGATLNNTNEIIIGTNNGGCFSINKNGEIIKKLNIEDGLQSNNVHALFIDSNNDLWLALNKGISKCEISLPISFWNESNGLIGISLSTIRFNGDLYIATHQGVYYLDNNKPIKIDSPISQSWNFFIYKDHERNEEILLLGANEGIFEIRNKKIHTIASIDVVYAFYRSKFDPEIVYFGARNNIGVLEYRKGQFIYKGIIPNTGISVRSIREDKNKHIWLSTFRHEVLQLIPSEDVMNPKEIINYGIQDGLPSLKNILIYDFKDELVFATEFGLFKFDYNLNSFIPENTFKDIFKGEQKDIFSFTEFENGDVWISQLDNKIGSIGIANLNTDGSYSWNSAPFNRIPEMMILTLKVEPNNIAWIGGTEGLFKFDHSVKKNYYNKFYTFIRTVSLDKDSIIFFGNNYIEKNDKKYCTVEQNELFKYVIPYHHNSIKFSYTSPEFSNESSLLYQYKLEGFENEWSGWHTENIKEYTNLREGNYIFKVRAQNIYNKISEEAHYEFTIQPPWYRRTLAYIGYVVIGVFLIFLIVRISIRRLRILNIELERLVEKRTYEINHQKEEILAQSEELVIKNEELEKLSIVARETDNAIAIADAKGTIEWVNEGFTRLYGYTFNDLQKLGYKTFIDISISNTINEVIEYCKKTGESKSYESLNHSKSGKNIWAQTTITPILNEDDKVIKLIAIDSDISKLKLTELEVMQQKDEIQAQRDFAQQQKQFIEEQNIELGKHRTRLEQLVKERTIDLEIAKEKAEQSDKLKSAFLANMSHEIRTPMNAIIGFSNLLDEKEIGEENKTELVSHIIHNSNTLLHLIDDIIDIAKIEAGQLEISKKNCQINNILKELFETYSEKKKTLYKENVELIFKPGIENIDFTVYSDPLRIQQILINLIDNALKFTEQGIVEIGYTLEEEIANPSIIFYVKDTGFGLSEEQQGQIFERFTKFENDKKKLYRGAGLGLAICKNITKLLGGDIWIESEPNKGSIFYFSIPYIKKTEKEIKFERSAKEDHYDWSGKTILIAEDEESNYRFLEMALSKTNVNLLRANDGIEAMEKYQKNNINLILMDIKMPNMDGLEATRRIRKLDEEIPIIAQTAFAMENDERISIEAGCNDYIAKPIKKPKLLELINKYLS
ncbi:response regulator [Bacteroidota bacterium]